MFNALLNKIGAAIQGGRLDEELDEEIRSHLELAVEEYVRRGMSPREAEAAARRDLGRVERVRESHRDVRTFGWLENLLRDVRVSARSLAKRRGFSGVVVLTLALGIAATVTVYTIVDGVLLRPLPYEDPSNLVAVGVLDPGEEWLDREIGLQRLAPISFPNFLDLRERARSFEELSAIMLLDAPFETPGGEQGTVRLAGVTPGLFEMLDASTELGRTFVRDDFLPVMSEVGMITYGTWQRGYGGDPAIVGGSLEAAGLPLPGEVVGVLSRDFEPPEAFFPRDEVPEFWGPIQIHDRDAESRSYRELYLLGRLRPGVTLEQARAEVARIAAELAAEYPQANQVDGVGLGIGVNGLHAQTLGAASRGLGIFLGAAGLLLLLAVLNAATLLLARSLDRARELGVRAALGAGRRRVVRLLVTEAALLSLVGGAMGTLLAYGGVGIFLRYAPPSIPRLDAVGVESQMLAVALAISLAAGLVAGLLPALWLTRRDVAWASRRSGPTFSEPSSRLRDLLVGGQFAVAVVLLCGAALLFASFIRMRAADPGFDVPGLVAVRGDEIKAREGQGPWEIWDSMLAEFGATRGVEAVGLTSNVPLEAPEWSPRMLLPGDPPDAVRTGIAGYAISPGYLETMGTRLLRGRDFQRTDGAGAERVALVNESFVRTELGGADPIGTVVRWAPSMAQPGTERTPQDEWLAAGAGPTRIVGLVEDVVQARVAEGARPAIYLPYAQGPAFDPIAVVRTSSAPESIAPALRRAATRLNPRTQEWEVELRVLADRLAAERPTLRFQTLLVGGFALVALLLAAAGLYGSLAHSVGRRHREIGIRMALGAHRVGLLGMVLRQGMSVSLAGLGFGIVASLLFSRALSGFLYGVGPNDPVTLLAVSAVIALVSTFACLAPARRATAVDPVRALRNE